MFRVSRFILPGPRGTAVARARRGTLLSEMRGRAARRFLGEITTPRRPEESLVQFLVGIN